MRETGLGLSKLVYLLCSRCTGFADICAGSCHGRVPVCLCGFLQTPSLCLSKLQLHLDTFVLGKCHLAERDCVLFERWRRVEVGEENSK